MFTRFRHAAAIMRPRELARTAARVEKLHADTGEALRRLREDVNWLRRQATRDAETAEKQARNSEAIAQQIVELSSSIDSLTTTVASMHDSLQHVERRAEQLTAISRADAADEHRFEELRSVLQPESASAHVLAAVEKTPLCTDPFPHVVIDDVLPSVLYDAAIAAIPPRVLFEDRPVNKQQLKVPPPFAPQYSRRVWTFLVRDIVDPVLRPAIIRTFTEPLREYLRTFWPGIPFEAIEPSLSASDGRIILRGAGYVIPPHRDPRWGFVTVIVYLARPGDPQEWGTQLYRVRDDSDASSARPYWINDARCELVKDIPFRPNRAIAFLNSDGAHGASIPAEAPPDFERYIYQWRIGANGALMKQLMAELTPEARAAWQGKDGY